MKIKPLTPHIGVEITGVDLGSPLDNQTMSAIHQSFLDWMVLVFRDQQLDREQHKAFGRRFGRLHTHPMNFRTTDDPELLMVKTTSDSAYTAGDGWEPLCRFLDRPIPDGPFPRVNSTDEFRGRFKLDNNNERRN